jgi:hypothetical protein
MPKDLYDPALNPEQFVVIHGALVEKDVLGVVQEIQRRWPNLRVQFLDPDAVPDLLDAPFQIVETDMTGRDRIVLAVWTLDNAVISHLEAIDSHQGYDLNAALDKANAKAKKAEQDQWSNLRGSATELVAGVVGSTKDTYSFTDAETGRKITTRTTGPHTVKEES